MEERNENSERPDINYTELRKSLTLCHIRRLREGQKAKKRFHRQAKLL